VVPRLQRQNVDPPNLYLLTIDFEDTVEEASDTALRAEAIVNQIRVERVVCEGVHSLGWME
jgi:hypothetical protein